ncbi:MAG: CDP-alcohol phosphatidyltransferase family protein [Myxococcales bacterium]|nr:CDP-alcohol phosphatidyltransferase family protein [Myxococcales bacterium]
MKASNMEEGPRLATWANALTLLRLAIAPVLVLAIVREQAVLGLGLFVVACLSDFADGGLARRLNQTSSLGGLLDHATDATLMVSGLAALSTRGLAPLLLPILVALAFVQYVVDSRATSGRPLRPNPVGRWNGIAYYVFLGTPLVRDAAGLRWPWDTLILAVGWWLVATTLYSMSQRFRTSAAPDA